MSKRGIITFSLAFISIMIISGCSKKSNASQVVTDQIKINEIMSSNNYYAQLEDGNCYDWIEFYNSSDEDVNLKGCMLSDNVNLANKWTVPADFVVSASDYGIIYLSGLNGVDEYGNMHTNFKLSSKGETIIFSNAVGDVIQQLSIPYTSLSNVSYGLENESSNYVWYAKPSPNAANTGNSASEIDKLEFYDNNIIINEYMSKNTYTLYDGNNQYSDWIELYNPSSSDVSLSGFALSDSNDGKGKWFFPDDAVIKANDYIIVFCSDMLSQSNDEFHANFGISAGDVITLYSIAGVQLDSTKVVELNPNVSCGRDIESGEFRLFANPTPGRANNTYSYELTSVVKAAPYSSLYISEVMCVSDNGGDYKNDFIEIHNASKDTVSLKGYGLSKNEAKAEFIFPDMNISPGEYVVIYCTGQNVSDANQTLCANFKLNQGGEDVYIFNADGRTIDILSSGKQTYGHSSGRLENERNQVYVFGEPSPGKANEETAAYLGYAPMPQFSSYGGYISAGFELNITAAEDCAIYYTLSGADPTTSSSRYKDGINITKNTVVKAIASKKGYLPSQAVCGTFLTEDKHSVPVVSIAADSDGLFSADSGILSKYVGGLLDGKANYYSNEEREVTFEYYIDGKKAANFNCMSRVFGETSRTQPQKSLALLLSERCGANEIYFPFFGKNTVDVFASLVLRPSGQDWLLAHLRDEFCAAITRGSTLSLDYMEYQPVALYINGRYWGLYYLREKLNEDYLVYKYGMTKGKIDIVKWERKQQSGSRDDYLALQEFCDENDLTVKKNYDYVCSQIDIESLMDWWIFETYVGNNDTGNVRCYRDQNNGKWKWMLFDLDNAFYSSKYQDNYIKSYCLGPYHGLAKCNNSIIKSLLKNPDFLNAFITRYFYHVKTTFAPDRILPILDELHDSISDEIPRQCDRWGKPTVSYFNYNVNIIKKIINRKPEMAKQQIKEAFRLTDAQVEEYYNKA